jgi:hypothetical protein
MRLMEVVSKSAGNPSVMDIGFCMIIDGLDICQAAAQTDTNSTHIPLKKFQVRV